MKKNTTNLKNTDSETEKGLKHLKLVGIGRDYIKERLAVMQTKKETSESSSIQTNGRKIKK